MAKDSIDADPLETSQTLLLRIRDRGAHEAWAAFDDRYRPLVLSWCRRWAPREADDAAQEVFTKLVGVIGRYESGRGHFRPWLRTVTENLMKDLKGRPGPLVGGSGVWERLIREEARTDLVERLASEYDLELVELASGRVRARVDPQTWAAFVETEQQGRKSREVGEELGMPVGSVYQARYSVKELIRREVECLGGSE